MALVLPGFPDQRQLADWCRETAAIERLQPWTVEKDFFLTRLIWGLAQVHGEELLLKGGTCLSKVDLGYHRMSEDVDVILPGEPTGYGSINSRRIDGVVRSLSAIGRDVGIVLVNFAGDRTEKGAHAIWEVRYESSFLEPASAVITFEAAIRPRLQPPRKAGLRQLLPSSFLNYADAYCWALDYSEVRAEKVRAAFTREVPEIRDFYDLRLLADSGADMSSAGFRNLVDAKLLEVGAEPLAAQPKSFGLSSERLKTMQAGRKVLDSVVRVDEPPFELQPVLDYYDKLWAKNGPAS